MGTLYKAASVSTLCIDISNSPDSIGPTSGPLLSNSCSYAEEWERIFVPTSNPLELIDSLRNIALNGKLRNSRFRSVCWRIFLGVLSGDKTSWIEETKAWREKYSQLTQEYIIDPHQTAATPNETNYKHNRRNGDVNNNIEHDNHPLSQERSSVWNRYFSGNETRREIMQDVVRTFPELEFFRDDCVRAAMGKILFCYSQISYVGYRQGMHEVLAPLLFVLHCDQIAFQHTSELKFSDTSEFLTSIEAGILLNNQYLEHDSFSMFYRIMQSIETWYYVRETSPVRVLGVRITIDELDQEPFRRSQDVAAASCVGVKRLNHIQDTLLKQHDLELYLHLERNEIVPQMYGLRWIRLLFGREYPLQDLLVLWDAIFAIGDDFALVDYIFVAMHIQVRDLLLTGDFSEGLCLLMRYPQGSDVHYIVNLALHFFKPDVYTRPVEQMSRQHFFVTRNHHTTLTRKVQRNRTSVGLDMLTSRFKASDMLPRFSKLSIPGFRKDTTQHMNTQPSSLPVLRNQKNSDQRTPRPVSLLDPGKQLRRPSSLEVARRQSSGELPSIQVDANLARCRNSMMESAPVTPTHDYHSRSQAVTPNVSLARSKHLSESSCTQSLPRHFDKQKFLANNNSEIGLPRIGNVDGEIMRELLQLCAFCASEISICLSQIQTVVDDYDTDCVNWPRKESDTVVGDINLLNQSLVRMNKIRDCLSGVPPVDETNTKVENTHKSNTTKVPDCGIATNTISKSSTIPRSFSSQGFSSVFSLYNSKSENAAGEGKLISATSSVVELKDLSNKSKQ